MDSITQSEDPFSLTPTDRLEAIRSGKQKAKEVVQSAMASSTEQISAQAAPVTSTSIQTQTPSVGRKRSRSGSRKPNGSQDNGSQSPKVDPHLRQYIYRDQLSAVAQSEQEDAKDALIKGTHQDIQMWDELRRRNRYDPGWIYGDGFQGYGNSWTAQPPPQHPNDYKIVYPSQRKRPGHRRTRELRYNRRDREAQKDRVEDLVPIRLDLEIGKLRLRDTFTWNLSDRVIPSKLFAENLVEDFQIPPDQSHGFVEQVHQNIIEQIQDFHPHPFFEEEALDPHLPYSAYKNDDMRVLVKLHITIGNHTLVDQFDWDINNPVNSPEDFAKQMASDLGLSGEFMTAIAHSIREQAQMFTKSLYIAGHAFDGRPVEDADVRENLLPTPLTSVFRPYNAAKDFASYFYVLNEADLERNEDAFQREQRQQKRSVNRRGGPSLPELKDRPRTVRTQIVSTVVPGAAESIESSGLYRPTARATGRGRRQYRADDAGSEVSESEESETGGSPSRNLLSQGTARTRGMRGAATAAQAAMRAAIPEALTPERQIPRQKRTYGWDYVPNPETGETGLVVRVKMPRERFRKWWREWKNSPKYQMQQRQRAAAGQSMTPMRDSNSNTGSSMPPPPSHARQSSTLGSVTPGPSHRSSSIDPTTKAPQTDTPVSTSTTTATSTTATTSSSSAAAAANTPPAPASAPTPSRTSSNPGTAPPPPSWLTNALDALKLRFPESNFAPMTRWNPQDGVHQPRIRCTTCNNGIAYKTDENDPTSNFETHLKHPSHVENLKKTQR